MTNFPLALPKYLSASSLIAHLIQKEMKQHIWTLRPDYCKYLDKWNFRGNFLS